MTGENGAPVPAANRPVSTMSLVILDDACRGFACADLTTHSSPDPPWCWRNRTRLAVCAAASRPTDTLSEGSWTVRCRAADLVEYCRWDGRSDHRRSDNHSYSFHVAPTRRTRLPGRDTGACGTSPGTSAMTPRFPTWR